MGKGVALRPLPSIWIDFARIAEEHGENVPSQRPLDKPTRSGVKRARADAFWMFGMGPTYWRKQVS
jgi:hypothetical protein